MNHVTFAQPSRLDWTLVRVRAVHLQIAFFALAAGLLASVAGYQFGVGDQIEELPIVFRAIDPYYLPGDFFLNASAEFNPRIFFAAFIAFFAQWASVETIFFVLTLLVHVAIASVSGLAAYDLFRSRAASVIAIVFVLAIPAHAPGSAALLIKSHLTPAVNAMPLVFFAIWAALRRKILVSTVLAATAGLLHPLLGLESGGLTLLAFMLQAWHERTLFERRMMLRLFTATLPLGIVVGIWLFQAHGLERIPDEQFISILAYFRNPHHYIPSLFNPWGFVPFTITLAIGLVAWRNRRNISGIDYPLNIIALFVSIILTMCVAGYVFVELFPVRIMVTAQVFRLLALVYWLAFLLIAGYTAQYLERVHRARRIMNRRYSRFSLLTALSIIGFLLILIGNSFQGLMPQIKLANLGGEVQQVAAFARLNTPEDAVFLTPPDWGAFRMLAERPILVDFKSFVFSDTAMIEWQQRHFDAYGEPESFGFDAQDEMTEQYHDIDDARLRALRQMYQLEYAVLFAVTQTDMPTVFQTDMYRIVRLESVAT